MLKNDLHIAIRNLTRNRFSAAINIGGLAIGMAVSILIGLWVYMHLSYNRSFPNHSRLAYVLQNQLLSGDIVTWKGQARQLAPALRKDHPGLFKHVATIGGPVNQPIAYNNTHITTNGFYTDPGIIDMLSLRMIKGDTGSLSDQSSIILSASMAKILFGSADPMGKTVKVNNNELHKVTGVYADPPGNSDFVDYNYIIPFEYLVQTNSTVAGLGWGNSWFNTLVQMNDNVDRTAASRAIKDVKYQYSEGDRRFQPELFLFPLDDWHLHSEFKQGVAVGGFIRYVRLFSTIGIFVLLLACINFMNLSTARSERRAKEVGIRKAMGSMRTQLIRQFYVESLVIALIAWLIALCIAQLLLPFFDGLAGKTMTIPYRQPMFWAAGLLFVFVTGLLAGSYPALYLSSFRPARVLKGARGYSRRTPAGPGVSMRLGRMFIKTGKLSALPRRILVVVQFSVSVTLIIGTIAVFHQIQYVKDRPVGYDRGHLVMVPMQNDNTRKHYDALRTQLLQTGLVEEVAASQTSIANSFITNMGYNWRGKDPSLKEQFIVNSVTPEFGKVAGWKIMEGRDFSSALATDSNAFIINETAARYMGLRHPIGEIVDWTGNGRFTIIGVVRDMVSQSPFDPVSQMIFNIAPKSGNYQANLVNIRVRPRAGMHQALAAIQSIFKQYDADDPFTYTFADQEYAQKFADEQRIGRLAGFFTILAILISCLGLLGLSAFLAEQRTREIGIRKVLGASVPHLWGLLSREFIWLVGLSLLIGSPIAYWIMKGWLNNYSYHASLTWWIFAVCALGALALTLFTVSFQAVRAALANPVDSLRNE